MNIFNKILNTEPTVRELTPQEARNNLKPVNLSDLAVKSEVKDRTLWRYSQRFKRKDFYERYKGLAFICLLIGYFASGASTYLSFAFLSEMLTQDVPPEYLQSTTISLLVLLEIVKHITMGLVLRSWYVYQKKNWIAAIVLLFCLGLSVFMCINGVNTSQEKAYNPPQLEDITTKYDTQIADLKASNKEIFAVNNYNGRLNESTGAAKAYAKNLLKIVALKDLNEPERERLHNEALEKYNATHTEQSSIRKYVAYFNEAAIVFCNSFWIYFMFFAQFEHNARLARKYEEVAEVQQPEIADTKSDKKKIGRTGFTGGEHESTADKNRRIAAENQQKEATAMHSEPIAPQPITTATQPQRKAQQKRNDTATKNATATDEAQNEVIKSDTVTIERDKALQRRRTYVSKLNRNEGKADNNIARKNYYDLIVKHCDKHKLKVWSNAPAYDKDKFLNG